MTLDPFVSPWSGLLAPSLALRWTFDLISLLPSMVVLIGWLALALLSDDDIGGSSEFIWLAALLTVVTAGNLLTLISTMLLFDFVTLFYFVRRESATAARRNFVTNQLGMLALVLAAVLTSADALDLNAEKLVLGDLAATFAFAGIGVRLNLFPFHLGLPFNFWLKTDRPLWSLLLPGAVNLTVLARMTAWLPNDFAFEQALGTWLLFGLAFAGIQAWRDDNPEAALVWAWQSILAFAFAAPLFIKNDARAPVLAGFITASVGLVLFEIARRVRFSFRVAANKIIWGWGILFFAGIPLTPSFFARARLFADSWNANAVSFVGLVALVMTFALTPLAANYFALARSDERPPTLREGTALGVIAFFALATSFTPFSLLGGLDERIARVAANAYQTFVAGAQTQVSILILVGSLAPVSMAFYLGRQWKNIRARGGVALARMISPLVLTGFVRFMGQIGESISNLVRMIYALVEHYPLGWILFAAIGIAMWLSLWH